MILGSEEKKLPPEKEEEEKVYESPQPHSPEKPTAGKSPTGSPTETKEEQKAKAEGDVVGTEPVGKRKNSLKMGAELDNLAGKSAEDQAQEIVKGETTPPPMMQEQLAKDNFRREQQQKAEAKPSKISELGVVNQDPMLKPFEHDLWKRVNSFNDWLKKFDEHEGGIVSFAGSYKKFRLNRVPGGIQYREWAPCAQKVCLCGDFNGWNRSSHPCKRDKYGVWELFVPDLPDGTPAIKHGSKVKAALILADGKPVFFRLRRGTEQMRTQK